MLPLTDSRWKIFDGGNRTGYDVSKPLRKLEQSVVVEEQQKILDELLEELYHQGDVGIASYLALPHLIRIGIEKRISDWRMLGLIAIIEIARHSEDNPPIPDEFENDYFLMLRSVEELATINCSWDRTFTCCALSAIAASKGHIDMAEVILELEDPDISSKFNEFLENY